MASLSRTGTASKSSSTSNLFRTASGVPQATISHLRNRHRRQGAQTRGIRCVCQRPPHIRGFGKNRNLHARLGSRLPSLPACGHRHGQVAHRRTGHIYRGQPCCLCRLCLGQVGGPTEAMENQGRHPASARSDRRLARCIDRAKTVAPQEQESIVPGCFLDHGCSELWGPWLVVDANRRHLLALHSWGDKLNRHQPFQPFTWGYVYWCVESHG
jgi:hypothetical protein